MIDDAEVTNELLLAIDNWLKPFLELVGDKIYLQSLIIVLIFVTVHPPPYH